MSFLPRFNFADEASSQAPHAEGAEGHGAHHDPWHPMHELTNWAGLGVSALELSAEPTATLAHHSKEMVKMFRASNALTRVPPLHEAGKRAAGFGALLAPLEIAMGIQEMVAGANEGWGDGGWYGMTHGGAEVLSGAATLTSVAAGAAGSTGLAAAGAAAAPLAGSLAAGLWIGHKLDDAFGISDAISDETSGLNDLHARLGVTPASWDERPDWVKQAKARMAQQDVSSHYAE